MVQAVSCRPFNVEAVVSTLCTPYLICGGQSETETKICPSALDFPYQWPYHSTKTPLHVSFLEEQSYVI